MSNLISVEQLKKKLSGTSTGIAIVDCRFNLAEPEAGRRAYAEGHLPGAVYMDLNEDLSGPVGKHGGRHPLPDRDKLARRLGELSIGNGTEVVAYDDQGGMYASRLWWLLKWIGHDKASVLDGGFSGWIAAGYETTTEVPEAEPSVYVPSRQAEWDFVDAQGVKARLGTPGMQLIDSREERRYLGLEEPIDKAAGHIPGARSFFWKDVLSGDGRWKDPAQLKERFGSLDPSREVIVYCGSGVSACPNVLALKEAGFQDVKLYAGSWSDWISYEGNPIATGEE
ncbi:sulfurtransferase [Paenibacillus thailandensis]|uniref:Sulfurtransferase n=1 Tax=Paenibacillus thailandensis TaxID=393250 RepID=A0ABW5QU32_9BACL